VVEHIDAAPMRAALCVKLGARFGYDQKASLSQFTDSARGVENSEPFTRFESAQWSGAQSIEDECPLLRFSVVANIEFGHCSVPPLSEQQQVIEQTAKPLD
jgi:hypothetical protein